MTLAEMEWEEQRREAASRRPHGAALSPPALFRSFWLAGFESACQRNSFNERIDMLAATQHDRQADEDYRLLWQLGIRTCRDGVRWPLIERRAGQFEFRSFLPLLRAAQRQGVQVIWALLHYGWPDFYDLMSPSFPDTFARFCRTIARVVRSESDDVPFYVPVNEISFLAWATGYKGIIHPVHPGKAEEIKRTLIRCAIAAMEAVWDVDPRARFCHVDPLIYVIPPRDRPDLAAQARGQHEAQWHGWDMIAGRACPELGGHPKYLDIVGVNYYHSNQWETPDVRLHWDDPPDPRRIPFHWMLRWVWQRYRRPFFIAETSHFGVGRGRWIEHIAQEIHAARLKRIPVEGVCLYPIIDRPDWENMDHWHHSGLFDLVRRADGRLQRVECSDYGRNFRRAKELLSSIHCR